MSGMEMARRIREIDKRVEIIFLTSYDDFDYAKRAIDVGAGGYVLKPLKNGDLETALKKAVSNLKDKDKSEVKADTADSKEQKYSLIVEEVNQYIRENINKKLSLREVAGHFNYSPNYLGHIYKEETQMYFNNYVAKIKIELAAKMLMVPQNQLCDISDALGYNNVTYFMRQFKQYYGVTPKTFRDNEGVN